MTTKPTVVEALASVMEEVRAVRKGDRNSQQGYNFRGIDAVMNAAAPAFRRHGVVVMPVCEAANYRDVETSTGKKSRECTVLVRYRFYGPAGDFIECVTPGESMDFGDKGAPKAMSVAYRIALLQALCLPTDDVDPDAQSYERGGSAPRQETRQERRRPQPADEETQPSAADLARDDLRKLAAELGIDLKVVANRYKAAKGRDLRSETDPTLIAEFAASLTSQPSREAS